MYRVAKTALSAFKPRLTLLDKGFHAFALVFGRKQAVENGMKTLRQSAISKVLEGITSIEEAIQKTQTEDMES